MTTKLNVSNLSFGAVTYLMAIAMWAATLSATILVACGYQF